MITEDLLIEKKRYLEYQSILFRILEDVRENKVDIMGYIKIINKDGVRDYVPEYFNDGSNRVKTYKYIAKIVKERNILGRILGF